MASYPNSPWYPGQRTPGVVVEFTTGDPSTSSALAGIPVSATNPFPVTIISGGGGGGGAVNLTQVGGATINIGQDPSIVGAASLPVVLPAGYLMGITGTVSATLGALVAGSAIIGKVGIDQTAGQNLVQQIPGTSGGLSATTVAVPNNTTGVLISTGAHQVYHLACFNKSSTVYYLKLYNKATAPTVGTDTPVWVMGISGPPAGGGGFVIPIPTGLALFPLGLGYGVTAGILDSDTTAPTAGDCRVNIGWK